MCAVANGYLARVIGAVPNTDMRRQSSKEERQMATTHELTDNIVYDLVSIQYHALQAIESYEKYLQDAHREEHGETTQFIEQCREQDRERVRRCHQLLGEMTTS
jgi:hypothetical protein